MNLPLRLAGCFVRHFVGVRGYLRSVREAFRGRVWVYCGMLRNGFWVLESVGQQYEVHLELA